MAGSANRSAYREKRRKAAPSSCHCCRKNAPFYWQCRCSFAICQECMMENLWGMTCNGITWECPDCGGNNGFGNQ